jgi:hypothetical protein
MIVFMMLYINNNQCTRYVDVLSGVVSNVKSLIIVDTTRIIERRGVILTNFKTLTCVGVSHLELK